MADVYKIIHPVKYFTEYLSNKVRPDGREFDEQRRIKLNVGSVKTAEASALVKCGNTSVVCGIKLELAAPKAEEPDNGFLVMNVELPPLCSSKFKPGPPSDYAQVVSTMVSDIITNSKFVDLKDLCIVSDKLAWVIYCDIICIDNDGSLIDACIISLLASLKILSLPSVSYDLETDEIKVDPNERKKLPVNGFPVATSFAIYQYNESNVIMTDPTFYEEEMCGGIGSNLVICYNKGFICGTQKFGGSNLSVECHDKAMKIAKDKAKLIEEFIKVCVENHEKGTPKKKQHIGLQPYQSLIKCIIPAEPLPPNVESKIEVLNQLLTGRRISLTMAMRPAFWEHCLISKTV